MLCRGVMQTVRSVSSVRQAGVLFDVDGVLLRGGSVIPAARRAFRKLLDQNNNFLFPVVFVTNAGSCQRHDKARQLSHLLDVQVAPEQVVLSHSPLRLLTAFHDKCVLVSGQGPLTAIANTLGFQQVFSVEQLRDQLPLLDMVEHQRPRQPSAALQTLPKIEAIILFGEPVRWETNLQEEGGVTFIAHVPVPSQKEVEEALVRRKKMELLQRYASETLQAQSQAARTLLGL